VSEKAIRPVAYPPGARRQARTSGKRPDGRNAEENVRQQGRLTQNCSEDRAVPYRHRHLAATSQRMEYRIRPGLRSTAGGARPLTPWAVYPIAKAIIISSNGYFHRWVSSAASLACRMSAN